MTFFSSKNGPTQLACFSIKLKDEIKVKQEIEMNQFLEMEYHSPIRHEFSRLSLHQTYILLYLCTAVKVELLLL